MDNWQQFIEELRVGSDPGFPLSCKPASAKHNNVDQDKHIAVFRDVVEGLEVGWLLGPTNPNSKYGKSCIISPLQRVPKPNNEDRIVHNLSYLKHMDMAVNSFIPPDKRSVHYRTIRDIIIQIEALGTDVWCIVFDMFAAYKAKLIDKRFHRFLSFKWYGKIYSYACMPFGLASACQIYTRFADFIADIIVHSDPTLFIINNIRALDHYLDDYWSFHPSEHGSWLQLTSSLSTITDLEVPTQWKKVSAPTQQPKIIGFEIDIPNRIVRVPWDKAAQICSDIDKFINNNQRTRRNGASVKGAAIWASSLVYQSKIFLREMDRMLKVNMSWDRKGLRLSRRAIDDLKWFKHILLSGRNGIPFSYFTRPRVPGDYDIWTDAALGKDTGYGGYTSDGEYFSVMHRDVEMVLPFEALDSSAQN